VLRRSAKCSVVRRRRGIAQDQAGGSINLSGGGMDGCRGCAAELVRNHSADPRFVAGPTDPCRLDIIGRSDTPKDRGEAAGMDAAPSIRGDRRSVRRCAPLEEVSGPGPLWCGRVAGSSRLVACWTAQLGD